MDDAALWSRMLANMRAFMAALAGAAPQGRTVELDGVAATIMPAAPGRSVVNCVIYERADQLARALDAVAGEYDRAGIRAWTVWVPLGDPEAADALARTGNVLDGRPAAMALELADLAELDGPELDLVEHPSLAEIGRLNDTAYGLDGDFAAALADVRGHAFHAYVGRLDGVPAACALAYDHGGDCGIYLVATRPEARGRGLGGALTWRALAEARDRGCTTSSLQATAKGRPIYERLGYRYLGEIQMWERRRAS
jgi:GNAT superfamily N-acetyltransferase